VHLEQLVEVEKSLEQIIVMTLHLMQGLMSLQLYEGLEVVEACKRTYYAHIACFCYTSFPTYPFLSCIIFHKFMSLFFHFLLRSSRLLPYWWWLKIIIFSSFPQALSISIVDDNAIASNIFHLFVNVWNIVIHIQVLVPHAGNGMTAGQTCQ